MSARATRPSAQDGFTLIETLVAVSTGVIVMFALFAIFEISLSQSLSIADRVQSSQSGRSTMTVIVDELHSACLSRGFTPVQGKSGTKELRFVNGYSEAAVPATTEAAEHRIVWSEGSGGNGTLTDYRYPVSAGSWPKFAFASEASPVKGTKIGEHIAQTEPTKGTKLPIFRYYKYATKASAAAENVAVGTLTALPETELTAGSAGTAREVAAVLVSFNAGPNDGNAAQGRTFDLSNQTTFAFSAPAPETTIKDAPCE